MVKRYGCEFTCLTMRTVHLEMAYSLDTNAFVNALRLVINHRGKPHSFYSDNGSNFFRGCHELKRSIRDLNQDVIEERMKQQEMRWHFNPPYASHMSGIWERVIRFLLRVLVAITDRQTLTDDLLSTLFSEAEYVVNSRLLTPLVLDASGDDR